MACDRCKKRNNCTLNIGRSCCFGEPTELEDNGTEINVKVCEGAEKLHITDWLSTYPDNMPDDIFEVRFKNTRKGYYRNVNNLPLKVDDIVAVESSPGHDIGVVSLTGDIVYKQMKRVGFTPINGEFKKIYRKAKPYDIEKWQEAIALEHTTMISSRVIAADMKLNMKIGDVEYQGDRVKAIFYYIADERVDFRELIKILADEFKIRIEMKQIGARQEAGRIGGIGACGRELCCSSWISNFVSVTTNAARYQEISLNPQKLAGQCGKLKCCLIYELDTYMDARKEIPRIHAPLETLDGTYHLVKTDIFKKIMWFSSDPSGAGVHTAVPVSRVKEIISINRKGNKAEILVDKDIEGTKAAEPDFANVVGMDSLTRFDTNSGGNKRDRKDRRGGNVGGDRNRPRGDKDRERNGENGNNKPNNSGGVSEAGGNRANRPPQKPQQQANKQINNVPAVGNGDAIPPQVNGDGQPQQNGEQRQRYQNRRRNTKKH